MLRPAGGIEAAHEEKGGARNKMAKFEVASDSWPFPYRVAAFATTESTRTRTRTLAVPAPHTVSLVQRSTVGLLSLMAVSGVMLAADVVVTAAGAGTITTPLVLGTFRLSLLGVALLVLSISADRRLIVGMLLATMASHTASGLMLGAWRGQPETSAIVAVAISVGCAVLLPWGVMLQAVLVSALLAILLAGELLLAGSTFPLTLLVPSIGAMTATVFLARELEATRHKLIERAAEDARARQQAAVLNEELEVAIAECTASLNATKEEFVGLCQAASHDLRPPLRSMAGFSEILRETAVKQARSTHVEHLDRIIGFADAMGTRIDDLLRDVRDAHREVARTLDTPSVAGPSSVVLATDDGASRPEDDVGGHLARRLRGMPPIVAAGVR